MLPLLALSVVLYFVALKVPLFPGEALVLGTITPTINPKNSC